MYPSVEKRPGTIQASKINLFERIVNGKKVLTIFGKIKAVDV